MKKFIKCTMIMLVMCFVLIPSESCAKVNDDYKVIKNASKKSSDTEPTWFKILVTDTETGKEKVKVTLPLSIIEIVADSMPDGEMKVDGNIHLDLKKLFKELKKAGPLALIEVYEDDETVKIWLE